MRGAGHSESRARRWALSTLGVVLLALFAIGAFNVIIDPFQQYHLATRYPPRFYSLHHRYINPGLAKHATYDTVLTGSSIMENTPNDVIDRACGGHAVNLAMPALSAFEHRSIVDAALDARHVKRVIMVLDFNSFSGAPDARPDVMGPLPLYLYDENPFNDLPYVLSWTVLQKSLRIVFNRPDGLFTTDPNAPWFWAERKRFGQNEVLRDLDLNNLNARFPQPRRTLEEMDKSFEQNILSLVKAHPETEFDLVWPPYSILVWIDFAQRRQLRVTFDFKREVVARTSALPNVHVTDLQSEEQVTHDLNRYTDLYHFSPAVNRWIVEDTCAGRERVDLSNVQAFEQRLEEQIKAWRPPLVPHK